MSVVGIMCYNIQRETMATEEMMPPPKSVTLIVEERVLYYELIDDIEMDRYCGERFIEWY